MLYKRCLIYLVSIQIKLTVDFMCLSSVYCVYLLHNRVTYTLTVFHPLCPLPFPLLSCLYVSMLVRFTMIFYHFVMSQYDGNRFYINNKCQESIEKKVNRFSDIFPAYGCNSCGGANKDRS